MQELACHLVRDRDEARELVQDAWLLALKRPPQDRGRPRAWIGTVMRNLVRQGGRRSQRRGKKASDAVELSDPRPPPLQELEHSELESLLRQEIEFLPESLRTTLREHFERGRTSAEIARRLGIPAGTVRWRVKAGIDQLRERLDQRYGRVNWTRALIPLLPRAGGSPLESEAGQAPGVEREPGLPTRSLAKPSLAAATLVLVTGLAFHFSDSNEHGESESTLGLTAGPVRSEFALSPIADAALERAPSPASGPLLPRADSGAESESSRPATGAHELLVVVQDDHGVPLEGAQVSVATEAGFEPRGRSAAGGRAQIAVRANDVGAMPIAAAGDRIALRASADGLATSEVLFVPFPAGANLEFALALKRATRTLRGQVLGADGKTLAEVDVFALHDPQHTSQADPRAAFHEPLAIGTRTDAQGRYELRGLPAESLVLCVRGPGEEPALMPIGDGEEEVDLDLPEEGTVRGRITDERGMPVMGARVWIEPMHRGTDWCIGLPGFDPEVMGFVHSTRTDSDGRYELRGVHLRDRRLYAQAAGDPELAASGSLTVRPGTNAWDAVLSRDPGLRLRLVDTLGEPLSGRMVQLISLRDSGPRWVRWIKSDAAGRLSVPEARTEADLTVFDSTGLLPPVFDQRVASSKDEQTIVVDERQLGLLVGRLVAPDGTVPVEARFEAYRDEDRVPSKVLFDPRDGRFRTRLQSGTYALTLRDERGGAYVREVEIRPGERARVGCLAPPLQGSLGLRADAVHDGGYYRLSFCFAGKAVKIREGALPLLFETECYSGLYRLDAASSDGTNQSGWVRVETGEFSELDLERLPRVFVEVLRAHDEGSSILLHVSEAGADSASETRGERRSLQMPWRSEGRLRHTLRLQPGSWRIEAEVNGKIGAEERIEIENGGSIRVRIDLRSR
jgi:RNA polymerase sigma-70 factor (ECF subfamily)